MSKIFFFLVYISSVLFSAGSSVDALEEESKSSIINTKSLEDEKDSDFLVAPIPFSNPTLGTGLSVVSLYMHSPRDEDSLTPTTAVIALYSSNDSWMLGVFHEDYWDSGKNRIKLGLATSVLNLKYYGIGDDKTQGTDYKMSASPIIFRYQRKIPTFDNFFFGGQYIGLVGKIQFKETSTQSSGDYTASALGLVATYDKRDEIYFPTNGLYWEAVLNNYNKSIGSDFDLNLFKSYASFYLPHLKGSTLATKVEFKYNSSTKPFFLLPSISLRGFDRTRYLDKTIIQAQTEERYKFTKRFGAVAFIGIGSYGKTISDFSKDRLVASYGAGLRYQLLKDKKINLSIDAAFSKSDSALYLRVGEAF